MVEPKIKGFSQGHSLTITYVPFLELSQKLIKGVVLHFVFIQNSTDCDVMMATNLRAVLTTSFLLMLAITLNARVIQEQGRQEYNGEMSREILHVIKQRSIGDGDRALKKEILALLLNDQEAKAQAASHLQSLFEGDLDLPQEEIDDAYGTTSKSVAAKAQEIIKHTYGKSSEVSDLHVVRFKGYTHWVKINVYLHACCKLHSHNYTLCW